MENQNTIVESTEMNVADVAEMATVVEVVETEKTDEKVVRFAEIREMLREVFVDGDHVYLVSKTSNLQSFIDEVIAKYTKRPNKRRSAQGRFNWIVKNFVRDYCEMHGKHLKVTLHPGRDKKGHFLKISVDLLKANMENSIEVTDKITATENAQPEQEVAEEAEKIAANA